MLDALPDALVRRVVALVRDVRRWDVTISGARTSLARADTTWTILRDVEGVLHKHTLWRAKDASLGRDGGARRWRVDSAGGVAGDAPDDVVAIGRRLSPPRALRLGKALFEANHAWRAWRARHAEGTIRVEAVIEGVHGRDVRVSGIDAWLRATARSPRVVGQNDRGR